MTKEITDTKRTSIAIGSFQGSRALTFNTLTEIHSFATMVCKTDLAPKAYKGKPEDATIAIIYGMEIGMPPMASLQNIGVVNGSPSVYGDGQLSLVQASGKYEWHKSSYKGTFPNDDFAATFEVKRVGVTESVIKEYSIADAKRAGLWGKAGTWTTNPKLMILYKPKSYALREAFADVLKGMKSAEEMEGELIIDVTPKSKTTFAHEVPESLKNPTQAQAVESSDSETPTSNTPFQDQVTDKVDDKAEALFVEIKAQLGKFKNVKAIENYLSHSVAEGMEHLKQNRSDYYAEILSIKSNCLEGLN